MVDIHYLVGDDLFGHLWPHSWFFPLDIDDFGPLFIFIDYLPFPAKPLLVGLRVVPIGVFFSLRTANLIAAFLVVRFVRFGACVHLF